MAGTRSDVLPPPPKMKDAADEDLTRPIWRTYLVFHFQKKVIDDLSAKIGTIEDEDPESDPESS